MLLIPKVLLSLTACPRSVLRTEKKDLYHKWRYLHFDFIKVFVLTPFFSLYCPECYKMVFWGWSIGDYNFLPSLKKNTQLCWEFVLSSHQPTVFRVTFGSLWKTGRANRTQYCFKSSGFGRSFIGSFTPGRPWWRPCWRTNRAYQDISISCWPLVDDFRCFRLVRHVHVSLFCLLWLVDLQTWVDLTRRRGCRPSGWAGQGGGHSEGRSRLRWWGNAVRGGAHREGWGTGLADGHVISEYGSPGA